MSNPIEKKLVPFLGILMLDTNFPRYIGDIGNRESFDFPIRKKIIKGAHPNNIIRQSPNSLLPDFIKAARELENEGAKILTTSCGFLTLFQAELQAAVSIPVLTSSLFMHKEIERDMVGGKKLGIMTIAASSLTCKHLQAANIAPDTPIGTTESGIEFTAAILENRSQLNFEQSRLDNIKAALELKAVHPELAAILLECTNMPPYANAISEATGLPVYSILDGLNAIWRKA